MNSAIIDISYLELSFGVVLVLVAGTISALFRLGLLKPLLWGTVRTVIQLSLIGYVLRFIFSMNHPGVILVFLTLMCAVASHTASRRIRFTFKGSTIFAFVSLYLGTFIVGSMVVGLILSPTPIYSARFVVPVFGMILGNSMNAISLALDRYYTEVRVHADRIETLLSFGASPWESVRDCVRSSLSAGMTPILNALMVVGVVTFPGIMTGQILAGADPLLAVRYQITVMLMIAAAVSLTCLLFVGLSYSRVFHEDGTLREI
jgi:putative ABC transport system permease protein